MKKKFFITLISVILISVSLSSCGKTSSDNKTTSNKINAEKNEKENLNVENKEETDKEESNTEENKDVTDTDSSSNNNVEGTTNNAITEDIENTKPSDFYIEEIIGNYEDLSVIANNNGDFSIISSMLIENTDFYNSQKSSVENSYNNDIKYNLVDYEIKKVTEGKNNTYKVYVVENMQVKASNETNFQDREFKYIYTIKYNNSNIGISNREEWN